MISIRAFEERDAPALTAMMLEMAGFYGATIQDGRNVEAEVLANARQPDTLLALRDGEMLAGFATFATLFPVGALTPFTYVQQVYVASSARRLGVAQHLMAAVTCVDGPLGARGMLRVLTNGATAVMCPACSAAR